MSHDNKTSYEDCFVAYLDILGFKNLVDKIAEKLEKIEECLLFLSDMVGTEHHTNKNGIESQITTQVRSFSDCIVLFRPVTSKRFGDFLSQISQISTFLYSKDLPLRGGIALDKMYWDPSWSIALEKNPEKFIEKYKKASGNGNRLLFGKGLNCAYELECKKGSPPRVVISHSLFEFLKKNIEDENLVTLKNGFVKESKLKNVLDLIALEQKTDGEIVYFFDFLNQGIKFIIPKDPVSSGNILKAMAEEIDNTKILDCVIKLCKKKILEENGEKYRDKFEWLLNYATKKKEFLPDK